MKSKYSLLFVVLFACVLFFSTTVYAHPGRTDANGCHTCKTNCTEKYGLQYGEYHCHNSGSTSSDSSGSGSSETKSTPKTTPKPSTPTPASTPTPEKVKTSKLINKLAKDKGANKDVILADLVLKEINNSKTSQTTKTLDTSKPSYSEPKSEKQNGSDVKFYSVISVTDGDTINVNIDGKKEKVRLLAIDTPETKDPRKAVQCFGDKASQKMQELVSGKYIKLEKDTTQPDRDKYGRLLRYIYLEDGTNVNAEMVKQGFAFAYTNYPTAQLDAMRNFEKSARESNQGLWGSCTIGQNGSYRSTNPVN
ncbi:MAG: thermonuclease family protein [Candidatus Berkelbacteria bacterium]|nr:thermonuclease family protein [Candidatus Berkelbacteria bacterium]